MMPSTTLSAPVTNLSPGLSASWAYRQRIPLTIACIIVGVCGTLMTAPMVLEETSWDHLCDRLAWCLLAAAIVLRLWAASHISGRKSKSLVTTGPYAICRNPLYVGTLLIAASQILVLKSWPFALACIVPVVLYATSVVPAEELKLMRRLGTEYWEYCQQVPRWTPRWSALNFQWVRPTNETAFRREFVRSLWWLGLPFVSEFVSALREWVWSAG